MGYAFDMIDGDEMSKRRSSKGSDLSVLLSYLNFDGSYLCKCTGSIFHESVKIAYKGNSD